jgi:hypothetical protein
MPSRGYIVLGADGLLRRSSHATVPPYVCTASSAAPTHVLRCDDTNVVIRALQRRRRLVGTLTLSPPLPHTLSLSSLSLSLTLSLSLARVPGGGAQKECFSGDEQDETLTRRSHVVL